MKLFEYFFLGKPVVSTPIVELRKFKKYVKTGATSKMWREHIRALISESWPKKYQKEQRRLALDNNWREKISSILKMVDNTSK